MKTNKRSISLAIPGFLIGIIAIFMVHVQNANKNIEFIQYIVAAIIIFGILYNLIIVDANARNNEQQIEWILGSIFFNFCGFILGGIIGFLPGYILSIIL